MDRARLSQGNSKPRDKGQAAGVSKLSLLGRMIQDLCLYVCALMIIIVIIIITATRREVFIANPRKETE